MKKLIILDLMGTLLEADHVVAPHKYGEYNSRIRALASRLNAILSSGREIIILTDISHTEVPDEIILLNDIYSTILPANREGISFIVAGVRSGVHIKQLLSSNENEIASTKGKMKVFGDKDSAYESIFERYKGYSISAVDDHYYTNNGFEKIIEMGGKTYQITNDFGSTSFGLADYRRKDRRHSAWTNNYQSVMKITFPYATAYDYINLLANSVDTMTFYHDIKIGEVVKSLNSFVEDESVGEFDETLDGIQERASKVKCDIDYLNKECDANWAFRGLIEKIARIQGKNPLELWEICLQIHEELKRHYTKAMDTIGQIAGLDELKKINTMVKYGDRFKQIRNYPVFFECEEQWRYYSGMILSKDKKSMLSLCLDEMDCTLVLEALYERGEISIEDLYVAYSLDERRYGLSVEEIVRAYKAGIISLCPTFDTALQLIMKS